MLNWVELDGDAIRANLTAFRGHVASGTLLGAVVKSNAYGHGMLEVARQAGADWLCVNNVEEAVALRLDGQDVPVLIMGYVPRHALADVVDHDLRPVVYDTKVLDALSAVAADRGRTVKVHLKVETGTQRQGVPEDQVPVLAQRIRAAEGLELEGVSTHFANIEDTTDHGFAEAQMRRFQCVVESLRNEGHDLPVRHAACSAATLLFTRTHLDLVRVGISLYGLWPSKETYVSCLELGRPRLALRPALTWKSRVAQVKVVPEGSFIGYGCTYRTTRSSRIAVLPVGYYEGYDRGLSGVAHVLVRGKRAPVRGRVCMNMCMVDVTDIPGVVAEDEVVLLGRQGDEAITAEQLATWCGTISYEIVSRIHPGLPRILRNRP